MTALFVWPHGGAMAGVEIALEAADSEEASRCLASYYSELASRFEEGFDPDAVKNFDPAEMTPPKGWFVMARLDGEAVGCGALKRLEPGVGEIKRVWVSRKARGRGVARALMARLEAVARAAGLNVVRLDTNRVLTEARAMYLGMGYREIAPYNDNSFADHWFEKAL